MATTYTNIAYPHTATITRKVTSDTMPPTVTVSPIWSGAVDCQVGTGGRTERREDVFVSDYTIFSACISEQLQTGDTISIVLKQGWSPFDCTIEQFSTDNIWETDGVQYGTTIWANRVKQ